MRLSILIAVVLLAAGCAGQGDYFRNAGTPPDVAPLSLGSWPHAELWTGVVFNGEKIGFTRRTIRPAADAPGRYDMESEAALRLRFLGVDKRVNLRAFDRMRADLTLEKFNYEHEIDGSRLAVSGTADGRSISFTTVAAGSRETKKLLLEKPLYASSALALLPLRGLRVGSLGRYSVFHGETQSVEEAEQEVLAYERSELFDGAAFKVATRLLGLETTTWIAPDGRPLFELALRGVMISALEEAAAARRYLVEASLNKLDSLVEFSLVRSEPIAEPRRVSRFDIALEGVPATFALPSDGGQSCTRTGEVVACRIDRNRPLAQDEAGRYLKASLAAPSLDGEIQALARKIGAGAKDDVERVERLLAWMDANIAKEAIDAFTAVDVLHSGRAECQGHSYLFAALARALGMPARIVNGLAYSESHGGFLYHTWNEAWIGGRGWQPVDATFGQPHADATHVKLVEGETVGELVPLVSLVGRLRAPRVSVLSRW